MEKVEINETNFIQELTYCRDQLIVILAELNNIEQDTPANHIEIQRLNGRFIGATNNFEGIVKYIASEKPSPAIVGDKLQITVKLFSEFMREKTRILKNTPKIIRDTNDFYKPN